MRVGDTLYGYCGGAFGRDSYGEKTVEHIGVARGKSFVIVSEIWWSLSNDDADEDPIMLHIYRGDPSELLEYTTPPPDYHD